VDVNLRDLYIGASKDIDYERMQVCKDCAGKGGKKIVQCSGCHGSGTQVVIQKMGYMTMQTQRRCQECNGEGTSIADRDRCKKCRGKGFEKKACHLCFDIPVGSKHADKIILRAKGHEVPDAANGDLVIVLRCAKHSLFNRVGADLAMTYKISLKQALCGYDFVIPHLSGFKLRLRSKPGEVVKHGQLKAVYGKGMPQKGSQSRIYGHLYVKFEIVFPPSGVMSDSVIARIAQLLPKSAEEAEAEAEEETAPESPEEKATPEYDENDGLEENVEDYEVHEEAENVDGEPNVTPASSRSAYDEDDEQEGASCRQM
jgi:DnaJ family protein A protein 2